ncbi:MAG TPA: DUF427 domain-containing protein [Solirubrobacteraceae bacterium]|nr:DUF427 domain-containing protein [Solirubrobacteraceae bacterium]
MSEKPILQPGPKHPITLERNPDRVVVTVAGVIVADTRESLTLREADYRAVEYIPLEDVDETLLERTDHTSYCPFKGDASYYSIPLGGDDSVNAVWEYRRPYDAVAAIKGRVAFYPDRVERIEQVPAAHAADRE